MLRLGIFKSITKPVAAFLALFQGAGAAAWTFPSVLGAAMLIAWAAEAAQFLISQGLALAMLAWLQTLPEFAVEAVIAWQAGHTAADPTIAPALKAHATALMTANLTGSLRIMAGLGWLMIYVMPAMFNGNQTHLRLQETQHEHHCAVEPFFWGLKALAVGLCISTFVFVQWVAPFLSEFPEKVSAFNWARRVSTAPMALMNMVSSNINQWTMLAAMLPIAYALALGHAATIDFDRHQELEILMTIGQSLLGALFLANMRFHWWEAALLFTLWVVQFVLSGFEKPIDPGMPYNSFAAPVAGWLSVGVEQVEAFAHHGKELITALYFIWAGAKIG